MQAHWLDRDKNQLTVDDLRAEGVLLEQLTTDERRYRPSLDALRRERGYVAQDQLALSPETPSLDAICREHVGEHYHLADEVRFVLEGEGVFDIRSSDDRWMRVKIEEGDLIVVPEKRHHRFMLTASRTIRCLRLFKDETGGVTHYREAAS
jgi:1,2-dihydroxy-3-keto-5-methylthiopentene dioxygenase